jgi:hypothetical protein
MVCWSWLFHLTYKDFKLSFEFEMCLYLVQCFLLVNLVKNCRVFAEKTHYSDTEVKFFQFHLKINISK